MSSSTEPTDDALLVEHGGKVVRMIAPLPDEFMEIELPRELWDLAAPHLIELHPDLQEAIEVIHEDAGMFECELDGDWQSAFNLMAMLNEAWIDEGTADIIDAWKHQPSRNREVSWFPRYNCTLVAVAQLLGTVRTPSPTFQTTVKPWMREVLADATIVQPFVDVGGEVLSWAYAETPLGVTCMPDFKMDGYFISCDPIFSTCPVSVAHDHVRDVGRSVAGITALGRLVAVYQDQFREMTGHTAIQIGRDLQTWSELLRQ